MLMTFFYFDLLLTAVLNRFFFVFYFKHLLESILESFCLNGETQINELKKLAALKLSNWPTSAKDCTTHKLIHELTKINMID